MRLYLAATDVNETQSNLFEIRCATGDPTQSSNYSITSVIHETRQGDGLLKISKFGFGDSNGNRLLDFVLGSFSLDYGQPHVLVLEENDSSTVSDTDTSMDPTTDSDDSDSDRPGNNGSGGHKLLF